MFTLKLATYKTEEKQKLVELLESALCGCFPFITVINLYEDGMRYCYKCEYRHFCKDIVTTVDFLYENMEQDEKSKFTLC